MTDEVLDLLTEFAQLFDPDAEEPDPWALTELLDELGAIADREAVDELVGLLAELTVERPDQLEPCERQLLDLGRRLTGDEREALLAGVDLVLGEWAADQERWAEASTRMARARQVIRPGFLDEHIGACEHILAEAAFRAGDHPGAVRHWENALAEHVAAQRWEAAAMAAGGLAEAAERAGDDERAQRYWRETADHLLTAGELEQAVGYATRACLRVINEFMSMPDDGATALPFEKARVTREFAVRHAVDWAAAELLTTMAVLGADCGVPWEQIAAWFDQARREYRVLDLDAKRIELYLAAIDLGEGSAAINRKLPVQAEGPLRAALPVFRKHGSVVEAKLCERQLTGLRSYFEPDLAEVAHLCAERDWSDRDSQAGSALIQAAHAMQDGRTAEAYDLLDQARKLAVAEGLDGKALAVEMYDASHRLTRGDPEPARRCVARIDAYLTNVTPSTEREAPTQAEQTIYRGAMLSLQTMAGLLRAALAQQDGGRAAAAVELGHVQTQLEYEGAGLLAAQIAVQRGRFLLDAGEARKAIHVVVPAVLALDAVRFSLDDARRRALWTAAVAQGFDAALRAAAEHGDEKLLAELIEVARANAVPSPRSTDTPALDELIAATQHTEPSSTSTNTLAGSAALLAEEHHTVLGVPAQVRTPWGTIALAEHLDQARRYHEPIRTEVVVDWELRP